MLIMMRLHTSLFILLIIFIVLNYTSADEEDKKSDAERRAEILKKKDVRDYNDADMERLFEQWEEDEEKDPDDLMEHERPAPKIDFSQMDPANPESILKMSKKGKTLMMFVTVSGEPTKEESETVTQRWQDQLFNANYQLQRYMVDSNRAIFLLKDGAMAWEIKDFLIKQDRCSEVTIDNKSYFGKASGKKTNAKGEPLEDNEKGSEKKKGKGKKKKTDSKEGGNVKVAGSAKQGKKAEDNKTEL